MAHRATVANDGFVESPDKTAFRPQNLRTADWKAVEEVLSLLARAIQQLHTYPATSPLCVGAIETFQRALSSLGSRDHVTFRVTPSELVLDDVPLGKGTTIEHELARRLHKAGVSGVTFERAASPREVARFCQDLVRCGDKTAGDETLLDLLTEHGVERIAVTMASQPEVLDVPVLPQSVEEDLARERLRFDAQIAKGGTINHLYPPQKGWIRLDPGAAPKTITLLDLAILADHPARLASMLLRLTDEAADTPPAEALEKKYTDVAMLIAALDPRVARRMFSKLARAVLDLDIETRQALLRRTVLPGLLDGRIDGAILRDFPDVDLAESLCLLLDLETAAPELLSTALARLDLPEDRRAEVLPLLEARLDARATENTSDGQRISTLARHARELVKVDSRGEKNFAEFAAFDLALDDTSGAVLEEMRVAVPATDAVVDQLTCLWHLLCLEPNPETCGRFLAKSFALLSELERASRGREVPTWLSGYRQLAERLQDSRPDVADVIAGGLETFCTPDRAAWIADLSLVEPDGRADANAVVAALGRAVAAPFADLLERMPADGSDQVSRRTQERGRAIVQLMTQHAAELAPAVVVIIERCSPPVRRVLLRVLGAAGPGYENAIGRYVTADDEQTGREALRALARLGTAKAARLVVAEILKQQGRLSVAAEETLWHFPAGETQRHMRELLGKREFTMSHPQATERLLDRAARAGSVDLGPVLVDLAPMRFRIWKPALARVARKAHTMLKQ